MSRPLRVLLHPADDTACGRYRVIDPAAALRKAGYATTLTLPLGRALPTEQLKNLRPDVVVFQRVYQDEAIDTMRRYRKALPKAHFVYDLDDLLWDVPASNPFVPYLLPGMQSRIAKAMKLCDVVTVSTEMLGLQVRGILGSSKLRNHVVVVENAIPQKFVNAARNAAMEARKSREPGAKPRVGWAGGASHAEDLALLVDAIKETADKWQWVFMGSKPEGVDDLIEFHEGVPFEEYPAKLGALDLDMAIAPQVQNSFNICKSGLRGYEFSAAGFANFKLSDTAKVSRTEQLETWLECSRAAAADWKDLAQVQHERLLQFHLLEDHANLKEWAKAWTPYGKALFDPEVPASQMVFSEGFGPLLTTAEDEMVAKVLETPGLASVSVISNLGIYPTPDGYAPIPQDIAEIIGEAAAKEFPGITVPVAFPRGPYVLLTAQAISRVGAPDLDGFGGDQALALMEWGARAVEAGMHQAMLPSIFVRAEPPETAPQIDAAAVQRIVDWHPHMRHLLVNPAEHRPLMVVRRTLDLATQRVYAEKRGGGSSHATLLVNGSQADAEELARAGRVPFVAKLNGPWMAFEAPPMPNVPPMDLRGELGVLTGTLDTLGIRDVVFKGLGEGSIEILGAFQQLHENGYDLTYLPSIREFEAPPHPFISLQTWQMIWAEFLSSLMPTEIDEP